MEKEKLHEHTSEHLPDHSEFDERSRPHVDRSKEIATEIAQNLFDIYTKSGIEISEWIKCLSDYLSEHFMNNFSPDDVLKYIREKIIMGDHGLDIDSWPHFNQLEKVREVAEWLAAEKIRDNMVEYEQDIENGINEGRYQEIHSIEEITVIKDHEVFHGRKRSKPTKSEKDEIIKNILEQYVIKRSEMLGHGTRVDVFELVPRRIPMPIPRRDELVEGLMLQSPNNLLVIRVLRESYKFELGNEVDTSEEDAIDIFIKAKKWLTFSSKELDAETVAEKTSEQAADVIAGQQPEQKSAEVSFIPPLIIIKAKLSESSNAEYVTIQKRIKSKGHITRLDTEFKHDVRESPYFRNKVRQFLAACKKFYKKTAEDGNCIPDTVGRGNVLYTKKGNIYLVDINNIRPEPDYRLISLFMLLKEIDNSLKSEYFKNNEDELQTEYFKAAEEIMQIIRSRKKYKKYDISKLQQILENLYVNMNDPVVHDFLRDTNMLDDKNEPIFMHNIDNLLRLEKEVLDAELDKGIITADEHKTRYKEINNEPMYRIFNPNTGVWENQRDMGIMAVLENKNQSHENWMSYYIQHLYGNIIQRESAL